MLPDKCKVGHIQVNAVPTLHLDTAVLPRDRSVCMAENILSSSAGTLHTADCLVPMSRADSMRNTSPAWAAVCTQRFVGSRTPWHDSTCGEGQRILLVCTSQQQMHAPRGVRPGGCRIGRRKLAGYLHPRGLRTLARYPYPSHEVRRVGSYRQAVSHYLSHRGRKGCACREENPTTRLSLAELI